MSRRPRRGKDRQRTSGDAGAPSRTVKERSMAPTTLAKPGPAVGSPTRVPNRWSSHPAVPAVISALLLWLSFPPVGWWFLSFFAPAFLFSLIKSPRSRVSLYFGSWVGGFTFWLL